MTNLTASCHTVRAGFTNRQYGLKPRASRSKGASSIGVVSGGAKGPWSPPNF